jgi:hypothetical protein
VEVVGRGARKVEATNDIICTVSHSIEITDNNIAIELNWEASNRLS